MWSRLPTYILWIFNWIPWTTKHSSFMFFTILLHIPGVVVNVVSVYALRQGSYFGIEIPKVMCYALMATIVYPMLHGYLFIFKSWQNRKANDGVETLHIAGAFRKWCLKDKVLIILLVLFCTFAVLVEYLYAKAALLNDISSGYYFSVFHFNTMMEIARYLEIFYIMFLHICFHMFLSFMVCICFSIIKLFEQLLKNLEDFCTSREPVDRSQFKIHTNIFHETTKLVSMLNEKYTLNTGLYVLILLNNIIVKAYLALAFKKCNLSAMMYFQIAIYCIAVGILCLVASSVHSKVPFL